MANLISPNVSVTITNEAFAIPTGSPTVPLFFIATAEHKTQPDGVTPALGTYEYGVVRTVTSLRQSLELYGTPRFLEDPATGAQYHYDARNEYGLFALNQFLGVGERAYVVRANVNLNDNFADIQALWDEEILKAKTALQDRIQQYIDEYNTANGLVPSDPGYKQTVTGAELLTLVDEVTVDLFNMFSFKNVENYYKDDQSASPLNVYGAGFDQPPTGTYDGLTAIANNIAAYPSYPGGGTVAGEFTPVEGADLLQATADDFKFTLEFKNGTALGANDAARRAAIVTALQQAINSNQEVRSETYDYNLVVCPGYPEVVDELVSLVVDIKEEAFVIADTPGDMTPSQIGDPTTGWAVSSARVRSPHVAYYYPWGLASNIDGKNVVCAPSGIALRTYAYNDEVAYLWMAPAGLRRGVVTGVVSVGYVTGQPGGPTTFNEVALNQGQRDLLYQYGVDVNPIVFFPGRGLIVWGQKTSEPVSGARTDRVHVMRLLAYIRRLVRRHTLQFVFEQNDELTRNNIKAVIENFLSDLVVKRALEDFVVIADESNNPPSVVEKNELYVDVAIRPTAVAEFIHIPFRIVSGDVL